METTTIESLPCKLTGPEKLLKSEQLAEKLKERDTIETSKKAAASEFKAQLDGKNTEIKVLAHEVRTGEEYRPIECTERPRYAEMMVDLVRTDTGDVVSSRPMHPSERQQALGFDDSPPPKHSRPKARKGRKAQVVVDEGAH